MCPRAVSSSWRAVISPSATHLLVCFHSTAGRRPGIQLARCVRRGLDGEFPSQASACSHGLGDLAIAIGAMELAAPSCCRLGLLAGGHLVLLAGAVDLPRSQCWSTHSSHLARVATRSFASHSRTKAFGSSDVSNAASYWRRRRPCSASAPSNRPTASSCGGIGDSAGMGWRSKRRAAPLPGLTAEAEPGSARLGLGWRFRAWLTSFGSSGLHRRTLFAPGLCSCGASGTAGCSKASGSHYNVPCIHENIFWKVEAGFSNISQRLGLSDKPRPRPCMRGS